MINKSGLKTGIKKLLLLYVIVVPLPITLFIVGFVFPQVPMMTLGYEYDGDFISGGQLIGDVNVRFSNQSLYLTYVDGGVYEYRSDDNGVNWINLLKGKLVLLADSSRMDVYNHTIGIAYYNYFTDKNWFIYSENQGLTWSTPREIPFYFNAIALINSTYIIACSNNYTFTLPDYNSTIYISRDLGLNWELQSVISSYIQQFHRYTVRVTQNQTIYMCGLSSTVRNIYSVYRSADLGKTWTEIETDFSGGRLIMGVENEFYIYSNLGNVYKSTDECQTWSHVEVTGVNRNDVSSPVLDINEDGEIFVAYTKKIPRLAIPGYDYNVLDYFWVGRDIWTGRYIQYFFAAFLPAAGVGFIVVVVVYGLYSLIKRDNAKYNTKPRENMNTNNKKNPTA